MLTEVEAMREIVAAINEERGVADALAAERDRMRDALNEAARRFCSDLVGEAEGCLESGIDRELWCAACVCRYALRGGR